MFRVIVILCNH